MSPRKIVALGEDSDPFASDVIALMLENKVGSVVLTNREKKPVGIVTERDILRKVSVHDKSPREIKAKDIMSSPVVTIKAYDSIETAAVAMTRHKIKRLVVVEQDGSMAGVLSITDITRKLTKILTDEYDRFAQLKVLTDL